MAPLCTGCGSLEHHRIVRSVFAALPRLWLEKAACLRLVVDPALDRSWFAELTTLTGPMTRKLTAGLADGSFGWFYASHPLIDSDDDARGLHELLRVVGRGFLVLTDGRATERYSTAFTSRPWRERAHGARYTDVLRTLLPQAAVLELVVLDACTLSLDSVYLVSLDRDRLEQAAADVVRHNIHARVFSGPVEDVRAADPAPSSRQPAPAASPATAALRIALPSAFDEDTYRSLYSDLAGLSPKALRDHYHRHGREEGRRAHSLGDRRAFAALIPREAHALELARHDARALSGERVVALDVFDQRAPHQPEHHTALSQFHQRFDAVFSADVLGRTPDFAGHLKAVRGVLRPHGLYFVVLPDKRYRGSHFRSSTSIADLLDAHVERRTYHSLGPHLTAAACRTHDDAARHWRGDHGQQDVSAAVLASVVQAYLAGEVDARVEAWCFEPDSFEQCVTLLQQLGESDFSVLRVYPTQRERAEFWAVLEAGSAS